MQARTLVVAAALLGCVRPALGQEAAASTAAAVSAAAAEPTASSREAFEERRRAALAALRARFLDKSRTAPEPDLAFSAADEAEYAVELASLRAARDGAALLEKGRVEELDDWQSFADMTVIMARRLGVEPPEAAIPLFHGRVRPASQALTEPERAIREALLAAATDPDFRRRYRFIPDLVGAPAPDNASPKPRVVYVRRGGKRVKRIIRGPELAPAPKQVSVIEQIDWQKADELAEVADHNAHGWDRKPRESARRYRSRLRRLRSRCYEWVRRDLTALGLWDASLFRGHVPPTRADRKRPVRAASFALAMAKIENTEPLAAKTSLRQLNLRVDPLVRGAIVVFSQSVCGYDPRSGHIEIVTAVDPLQAASFKFHPVKLDCLVKAANENKVHVFVPLRSERRG